MVDGEIYGWFGRWVDIGFGDGSIDRLTGIGLLICRYKGKLAVGLMYGGMDGWVGKLVGFGSENTHQGRAITVILAKGSLQRLGCVVILASFG